MTTTTDRTGDVVLEARGVAKHFPVRRTGRDLVSRRRRTVHAVDDVSLQLRRGTVTALVGESGSGKSTVARLLAQLYPLTEGEIRLAGKAVKAGRGRSFRAYVRQVQLIFQDPFASLNPVHTVRYHLTRALTIHGREASGAELAALLERVQLTPPRSTSTRSRTSCRGDSASAWPSPARSAPTPRSCSPTSPSRCWTSRSGSGCSIC